VALETSEERVKLIKAGYNQKEIEEIYLASQSTEVALTIAYPNRSRAVEYYD